jgi:DNA-nicking Smr family endonuclease
VAKLSDLKKLMDDAGVRPPAAPARTAPPTKTANANARAALQIAAPAPKPRSKQPDVDLSQAFADVAKIAPTRRAKIAPPKPSPIPRQRMADDADALEASKYGEEEAPYTWDIGQELEGEQTFVRKGIGTDVLAKLRRGHWFVQDELDLHGHISGEAHDALVDFLAASRKRGFRCVRVVHGKGLTSRGGEPVLKGKVRKWLAQWDDVLAYCETPNNAGGGGALFVLLRGSGTSSYG